MIRATTNGLIFDMYFVNQNRFYITLSFTVQSLGYQFSLETTFGGQIDSLA